MTAPVVEVDALTPWLRIHVPALVPPLRLTRIGAGQSNVTHLVRDRAGGAWVLRRPPPGARDRSAHDVHREARILRALAGSDVPVPGVVATGTDEAGIEGPFCVMAHADGVALADEATAAALPVTERAALATDVITVLAALHAVDPGAVGLGDLGPRQGYVGRQLRRTTRSWATWGEGSAADPTWQEVARLLREGTPAQQGVVIAHGDYRLSNLLVAGGRVTAVLDWELCTLGDPLADLAWLMDDWRSASEPGIAIPSPTRAGGFPGRAALLADYAARTGLDLAPLPYYRAFTHWRAATLLRGVLVRRRSGGLGDHGELDPTDLEDTIGFLLDEALEMVS